MSLIADIHNDMEKGAVRLITEYRARLISDAVRICENIGEAEDLVDRTFVKVIRNIESHHEDRNLYGWMKTIMVNVHRNDLARPVARGTEPVDAETLEAHAGADWSTDEEILRNSDSEAIHAAIKQMSPKYQEAILMRYYDEMSVKEIAAFLGKPIGTVCRRIQIAHQLLAGKLAVMLGRGKKPLAVVLVAFLSLVSAAAVATLPAFEPLRATVAGWFGSDATANEEVEVFAEPRTAAVPAAVTPTEGMPETNEQFEVAREESQEMNKITNVIAAAVSATVLSTNVAAAESPASQPAKTAAVQSAAPVKLAATAPVLKLNAAPGGTRVWTGATSGDWHTPTNWDPEGVPTATNDIVLAAPESGSYTVTASQPIGVRSLTIGSDGAAEGCTVTFESQTTEMHQIGGDLVVHKGGVMTHVAGTDATPYKLNLSIGGDATVAEGGLITADEKGVSTQGAGGDNYNVGYGSYGGRGGYVTTGHPCYGSIREPNDLGSRGMRTTNPGGGAIRLDVGKVLQVDGSVCARGSTGSWNGSGGSIWITAKTLSGSGHLLACAYGSGGGGRIAIKQTEARERTAFTGEVDVGSGGTLYREDAGDESGRGELIFKSGTGCLSELSAAVTDAQQPFGKITFDGTGMTLIIMDDLLISSCGDISAAGNTIKADVTDVHFKAKTTGGVMGGLNVLGSSEGTTHVSGTFSLGKFICTNGTDLIEFAKGTKITLKDSAQLYLNGVKDAPLTVMSAEPSWNLTLGNDVDAQVKYVAASNSIASATIVDFDGTDLGGNENWTFSALPKLDDPIVWTGEAGSSWSKAENWVDKGGGNRLPIETDCVVISNGCPAYPTLTLVSAAFHKLLIGPGAELTIVDTPIAIASDIVCDGKLVLSGTTSLSAAGDVTLAADALTMGPETSFALADENEQLADLGGNQFSRLTVDGPSVTFANGFTAASFRCEQTRAVALRFSAGDTYAATDLRMLPGAGGSLTLDSTVAETCWKLAAGAGAVCDGVSVADCDARDGSPICVTTFVDRDNNYNWRSGATAWTGAVGTDWEDPENWSGGVPTSASDVRIFPTENAPTLSSATGVRSLVVGNGNGPVTLSLSGELAISDFLRINGGATVIVDQPLSVTGDVFVASGAKLTHTLGTDKTPYKLHLYCGGNMTIDTDGSVSAKDKGKSSTGGGDGLNVSYGTYGGRGDYMEYGKICYGSIREPDDLGSHGGITSRSNPGGGVVKLTVGGTLCVDGSVDADVSDGYYPGSGGSVWLTVGTLSGRGRISARSDVTGTGMRGGGGRIAIKQTKSATRTAFSGKIDVDNGTLYREDCGDEAGVGELILQGSGANRVCELSRVVDDATNLFKKITFMGEGLNLIIMDDIRVPVRGDVLAAGNIVKSGVTSIYPRDYSKGGIMGGFDILGPVDGTTHLSGTFRLGTFICTNGAESLEFAAGMTMTNYSNGTLWLAGTDRRKTVVRSSRLGSPWFISVGTNVAGKVRCLDVYDSDASGGQTIKAKRSNGRKGRNNVNWEFPAGLALIIK